MAKKKRIIKIDADEVMAGDRIVISDGSIRKFFHVCEISIKAGRVSIIYNVPNGFGHIECKPDDRVRVRDN